ncbi:hypothetical protein ACFW9L_18395 [Streptomyces sp. NPDC059517]|uniref:hypothetical protein n=1 Tax=Streptomyces sp. NPDC059517 TaxID=3346855 RepID=UPI0036C16738
MRYAQRGGYTPAEQEKRELLRREAAERFERGDDAAVIAAEAKRHGDDTILAAIWRWISTVISGPDQSFRSPPGP